MDTSILVSVIIPTYKRDVCYLARALKSVLCQTYEPIEIIVIDDSPEEYSGRKAVAAYMEKIQKTNPSIIYLQNAKNMGGSFARNRGISVCHGEYITFLDDDDEYKPRKIEKQVNFMLENECDMSFSNMVMYDNKKHVVDFRNYTYIKSFDNDSLLHYHLTRKLTGTPTFMYKSNKIREIGGFDDAIVGQEFYLMLKTIEHGMKIRYMNDCDVIVYRHPDGGISQGKNKIIGENLVFNTIKKYYDRLSFHERRFATFRHWAVLAIAYKRNRMYGRVGLAVLTSFIASPIDFISEICCFFRKVQRRRQDIDLSCETNES